MYNRSVESNVVRKKILLSSSSLTFLVLEVVCLRNTRDCVFEFRSEELKCSLSFSDVVLLDETRQNFLISFWF